MFILRDVLEKEAGLSVSEKQMNGRKVADINEYLMAQVRDGDETILDVSCGDGRFGAALKTGKTRRVFGVEADPFLASLAKTNLDAVYQIDITKSLPPIARGSVDCIVLDGILERIDDPVRLIQRLKPLLSATGQFVCAILNGQHFSALGSMIAGDFQYQEKGILSRKHIRFYGRANVQKMFLDSGCMPHFGEPERRPVPQEILNACRPLAQQMKINPDFLAEKAAVYQYIFAGVPMAPAEATTGSITFVVAVNNPRQFQDNLLASPVVRNGRHEVVPVIGAGSAGEALKAGLAMSRGVGDFVVLLHQDIYLPRGWDDKLISQMTAAEQKFGPVGVAGVFGVLNEGGTFERAGKLIDRVTAFSSDRPLPARATSLDEIVLAFPRGSPAMAGIANDLGFHWYGSEACFSAAENGLAAIVVDAPCLHNTEAGYTVKADFMKSSQTFAARRSSSFPYASTCAALSRDGGISVW